MKNSYFLALVSMLFFVSCAPRYGAHFQPSQQDSYAQTLQEETTVANEGPARDIAGPNLSETSSMVSAPEPTDAAALLVSRSEAQLPAIKIPVIQQEDELLKEMKLRLAQMSAKERRALRHKLKNALKEHSLVNAQSEMPEASDVNLLLLILITILIPPLGMFLYEGDITKRFWISLLLTLLLYVPGLIYTLVVILGGR